MTDWFKNAFDENYLTVYNHRDQSSADCEIERIISLLNLEAGQRILDMGCGNGRHCNALSKNKMKVYGLDLSSVLLCSGQSRNNGWEPVRGNMMHLPFRNNFSQAVLSLFTSFGYFMNGDFNSRVLKEVNNSLICNGKLLIDFLNRDYLEINLEPHSEIIKNGYKITEERAFSSDGKRVEKKITILQSGHCKKQYMESVRAYSCEELCDLLVKANFYIDSVHSDFSGSKPNNDKPRLIIIAGKK
ncbi:MAG: class I SAM-dependent methyltransferase [bacterium]